MFNPLGEIASGTPTKSPVSLQKSPGWSDLFSPTKQNE
jgi:hypothetical protein